VIVSFSRFLVGTGSLVAWISGAAVGEEPVILLVRDASVASYRLQT
jgi:hypothetical protein